MPLHLTSNSLLSVIPMSDESLDLFEQEFWSQVEELAAELGVSTRYIEEEFIMEGEIVRPKEM